MDITFPYANNWSGIKFQFIIGDIVFIVFISLVDVIKEPASEYNFNLMACGEFGFYDGVGKIKSGLTPKYSEVIRCRFLVLNAIPE
jgi:hypothetical protein